MEKFTIRDFLVYFSTGLIGILLVGLVHYKEIIDFKILNSSQIEKVNSSFYIASIPLIYFIGHMVQTFEDFLYVVGKKVFLAENKSKIKIYINSILNGHRVEYVLQKNKLDNFKFWEITCILQLKKQYLYSEYWLVMGEFFKSLYVLALLLVIYSLCMDKYLFMAIYFIIAVLTWFRSKGFAITFVATVIDTHKNIDK